MVYVRGSALIQKAGTNQEYRVPAEAIQFQKVGAQSRQMGSENEYSAVLEHPQLGTLAWNIWEYPEGVENNRETNVGPHVLLEDFEFGLDFGESITQDSSSEDDDSDEDDETDPEKQTAIDKLVEWFHQNYEDPANRLPYVSAEGGYQWIYGGPYEAREVLSENFPDEAEDVIEAAVEEIEADGLTDWAPVATAEDYDQPDNQSPDEPISEEDLAVDHSDSEAHILDRLKELTSDLDLTPSGPTFQIDSDGLLHLATSPDALPFPTPDPLFDELKLTATKLLALLQGTNAYANLFSSVQVYVDAVTSELTSLSRLYARGVWLTNSADATRRAILAGDTPSFPLAVDEALSTVLELHRAFIMAQPESRALATGAADYHRDPRELQPIREVARKFASIVEQTPALFGSDVIAEVALAAENVARGPQPDRSIQVASKTFGNLIKYVFRGVFILGGIGLTAIVGQAALNSAPGIVLVATGTSTIDTSWMFLLEHYRLLYDLGAAIGSDLSWLTKASQLLDLLKSKRVH